jgi:enediyne biosynthesis protein E4
MFFDFDNDGWPDLILVNGHVYPEVDKFHLSSDYNESRLLYHNNGDATFTDVTAEAGLGITTPAASRGMAVGDLWNDGQIAIVTNNMNQTPSLLVNSVRTANHWVALRLIGTKSNRDGIGAKITRWWTRPRGRSSQRFKLYLAERSPCPLWPGNRNAHRLRGRSVARRTG